MNKGESFVVNDRVNHAVYGLGVVSAVKPGRMTIKFDDNSVRMFVTSMVQLERSSAAEVPPPKKTRAKKTPPKKSP